jgi:hypothetical protein
MDTMALVYGEVCWMLTVDISVLWRNHSVSPKDKGSFSHVFVYAYLINALYP